MGQLLTLRSDAMKSADTLILAGVFVLCLASTLLIVVPLRRIYLNNHAQHKNTDAKIGDLPWQERMSSEINQAKLSGAGGTYTYSYSTSDMPQPLGGL